MKRLKVVSQIQSDAPLYHHHALRMKLISKLERISPKSSLASLRGGYLAATYWQSIMPVSQLQKTNLMNDFGKLEMEDPDRKMLDSKVE